ncbi:ABC transporter substrate-binding protein [Noviherbaspirillum sp. ST9]|uniref:ABC transporter substrate-binding protein n=1 Tax=Noviherbaspirillum sp. ST9 TaxID=3401606 RepID=UPI003B586A1A
MATAKIPNDRHGRAGTRGTRVLLGLWSAFAVGSAVAQTAQGDVPLTYPGLTHVQGQGHGALEFRDDLSAVRYAFSTISLAELGDATKRFDAQTAGALAVVYPDIGEPYRSVFAKIIEGIEDGARLAVHTYPIGPNQDPAELNGVLKKNGTKVVIALGRQGLKATSTLDSAIPVVVGGVLAIPEAENRSLTGISLTPDPALLFTRLKNLMPAVKRVIVVYNPQHNEWLVKIAREAARSHGLELATHEARDLAAAARAYETAFASADGRRDAIWLPQDATTVEENTILPLVLKESWNRNVPVFSSSFLHVKKGALFALYPNNLELGRTLANSALAAVSSDGRRRGVLPLREVQTAVNLRTASHIGLTIGYQQQRSFDFIFPEP